METISALQRRNNYELCLITSSALILVFCYEVKAQTVNVAPPTKYSLDENGVNLGTGAILTPRIDVSIGPKDDPLQLVNYGDSNFFINYQLNLYITGTTVSASILGASGPTSEQFNGASGAYVSAQSDGSTLTDTGAAYVLVLNDGTQYIYANKDISTRDATTGNGLAARLTEIKFPDGSKISLVYKKVTYTCPNGSCTSTAGDKETKVRIQSISRSDGYQIHINYKSNLTSTGQQQSDWDTALSAVAVNQAIDFCDPDVDTCSLSQQWPTAYYQTNLDNGVTVFAVTTAEGVHKYWAKYDTNGFYK